MANEKCIGCALYSPDGRCIKLRKNGKCNPSTAEWFVPDKYDEPKRFIPIDRMCRYGSIFGNDYIGLTLDDIERLKNGEVIFVSGEYGIFVGMMPEEKE